MTKPRIEYIFKQMIKQAPAFDAPIIWIGRDFHNYNKDYFRRIPVGKYNIKSYGCMYMVNRLKINFGG